MSLAFKYWEVQSKTTFTMANPFQGVYGIGETSARTYTVPGHKSWSAGPFLKQNYPKYRLCEENMGGSFRL